MTRTIMLKGGYIRKEAEASGVITPGHLVEFGGSQELQVHGSAGGAARKAFALENDLVGRGIDDNYAQNETVQYAVFESGAEIYAFLVYPANVSKGDALVSAGDGTLDAMGTNEEGSVVAFALEDKDNSTGGAAVRIMVEAA